MIFQALSDGNLRLLDAANTVYQGSVGTRMYVISPDVAAPSATGMMVSFTYPDGTISSTALPMEALYAAEGAGLDGLDVRIWSFRLRAKETERKGDLGVSVSMVNGDDVITSYAGLVNIAYSAVPAPTEPAEDDFATLQALLAQYYGYITSVVGNNDDLTTEATTLVGAINEHGAEIGSLADLRTDNKESLVGAINEVDLHTDGVIADLGDISQLTNPVANAVTAINNVDALAADNQTRITAIESREVDGETPIGYVAFAGPPDVATLNSEVQRLAGRSPRAGDVIIWENDYNYQPDEVYKCMYFHNDQPDRGSKWNWWKTAEAETASDTDYGVIMGGRSGNNGTVRTEIVNGQIKDMTVYSGTDEHAISTVAANATDAYARTDGLIDGTVVAAEATHAAAADTSVLADKAVADELGENIPATYARIDNTLTLAQANERFMSKHFGRVFYLDSDTPTGDMFLVTEAPTDTGVKKQWALGVADIRIERSVVGDYIIEPEVQISTAMWVKANIDSQWRLGFRFYFRENDDAEWTQGCYIQSNVINFPTGEMTKVVMAGNLTMLNAEYHVGEGASFKYEYEHLLHAWPEAEPVLDVYSDIEHPSTINFEVVPTSVVINYKNGYKRINIANNSFTQMADDPTCYEPTACYPRFERIVTPEEHKQPVASFYDVKLQELVAGGKYDDVHGDISIDEAGNIHLVTLCPLNYVMWVAAGVATE